MRLLIVNILPTDDPAAVTAIQALGKAVPDHGVIHTREMDLRPCVGCNACWLKTPGICVFDDDYKQLLEKIHSADKIWLISETRFGFISFQAKKIVDRIMPLLTKCAVKPLPLGMGI